MDEENKDLKQRKINDETNINIEEDKCEKKGKGKKENDSEKNKNTEKMNNKIEKNKKEQKNEDNNDKKKEKEKKEKTTEIIHKEDKENNNNNDKEGKISKSKVKKEIKIQITISKLNTNKNEKKQILEENKKNISQKVKNIIKKKDEQINYTSYNNNRHIIKLEKKPKILENMNLFKNNKSLESPFKQTTVQKIDKNPEIKSFKNSEPNCSSRRCIFDYSQREYRCIDNSYINSLNSIPCCDRANCNLLCSFGSNGCNNSPPKNKIHLPIGIASASRLALKSSQNKHIRFVALGKESLPEKKVNIFKPVPKIVIHTSLMQSKIQLRKSEGLKLTNKNNSIKRIPNNFRNNNNNYINEIIYRNSINHKLKYYIKCPHCNYTLNDVNEINKYYNEEQNNNYNNRNKYDNLNQIMTRQYTNQKMIKNENHKKIKMKILDSRNKNNDLNKRHIYSIKNKISDNYFRNSMQTPVRPNNSKNNLNRLVNNHSFYQSYGTSLRNKNKEINLVKLNLKKYLKKIVYIINKEI